MQRQIPPQPQASLASAAAEPAKAKPAAPAKAVKAAPAKPAPAPAADKPAMLAKPRAGGPDDLKLIWGVGPKLEAMLHKMGVFHFDQVASWTKKELAWVDSSLEGFHGRAIRDEWVKQAKKLAKGWRPDSKLGDKPKGK